MSNLRYNRPVLLTIMVSQCVRKYITRGMVFMYRFDSGYIVRDTFVH